MNTEIIENLNLLGKTSYAAMKAFYDINMKLAGQLHEQQMAYVNLAMEFATAQMEITGKADGYSDIISGQTALINEATEKVQGIARNTVDIVNESKDEVSAWVEKGVEDAASIVPFAQKSA